MTKVKVEVPIPGPVADFIEFVREQGIIGLSIGFVMGSSVSQVVTAFTKDIIDPLISLILGKNTNLNNVYFEVNGVQFMYGHFLSVLINFFVIMAIVYFVFKRLNIERLDKKKEDAKK